MVPKENETLYEQWYGKKPDVSHLKVFGFMAYILMPDGEQQKLDKKSKKMHFVGYSLMSKGYRLLMRRTESCVSGEMLSVMRTILVRSKP